MTLIDSLSADYPQKDLLNAFDVARSSYQYHRQKVQKTDTERNRLKAKVTVMHKASRGAAGSRVITGQLKQQHETIGRYKVSRLMKELGIKSKQPGPHRYKPALKPSDIAPNHLNRAFNVGQPDHVWCGDVTYIWVGNQWLYLALVMDLYARRIIGWACSDSPNTTLTTQH